MMQPYNYKIVDSKLKPSAFNMWKLFNLSAANSYMWILYSKCLDQRLKQMDPKDNSTFIFNIEILDRASLVIGGRTWGVTLIYHDGGQ